MSVPRHTIWSRVVCTFVLTVLGAHSFSAPLRAEGCHGPDRPVLGLSILQERPSPAATEAKEDRLSLRFVRRPCSAEHAGAPVRILAVPTCGLLEGIAFEPRSLSRLLSISDSTPLTRSHPFRIDRPPRPVAA